MKTSLAAIIVFSDLALAGCEETSGGGSGGGEVAAAVDEACGNLPSCVVNIDVGEVVGIDVDRELLNSQRDYWLEIAKRPEIIQAKVILTADNVELLNVVCDRKAFTRLDWGSLALDPDAVKKSCEWYGEAKIE